MVNHNAYIKQNKQIRSFSVNKDELRRLLELLQERADSAAELEQAQLPRNDNTTDEEFEQAKNDLKEGFQLFITLTGVDGRSLTGSISEIFDSVNFPEEVRSVFFDTSTTLKARFSYIPRNKMVFFLDFSRPEVLNFSIMPSQETFNESNFAVEGDDATWVNGVFREFFEFISRKPSTVPWLHRHTVYDVMLWFAGFPLSFWFCYKLSNYINQIFGSYSTFLQSALYFYVFVISLIILRIAFHYARWIWPLTEYQTIKSKAMKHKTAFAFIFGGLGLSALYDIIKSLIQ